MELLITCLGGLLLGGLVGWLLGKSTANKALANIQNDQFQSLQSKEIALTQAQTQLNEVQKQHDALLTEFKEHQIQLSQAMQDRSALRAEYESLKSHYEQLETQRKQQFEAFILQQADVLKSQLEEKASKEYKDKQSMFDLKIETILRPLYETMNNSKKEVQELHQTHQTHHALLNDAINKLHFSNQNLTQALSHNKGRGDWGELELIRLLEDSGLQEGIDYEKQAMVGNDKKRPDIRIKLPDGRFVFVDAKALQVDLSDMTASAEDFDNTAEKERQRRLARSLEAAIKNLSGKEYQSELEGAANIVVLFVPRESMIAHALSASPHLFEMAYKQNIILSGPFNLIGLLKLIHYTWQQTRLSKNATEIQKLAENMYAQAELFTRQYEAVGKDIGNLIKHYNQSMNTLDGDRGSLLKRVRALEDFGAKGKSAKMLPSEIAIPEEIRQAELLNPSTESIEITEFLLTH